MAAVEEIVGEPLPISNRVLTAADHVALRALIKYMSSVLDIAYKTISEGSGFNESTVKNYANDKSSRSVTSRDHYTAFATRCGQLISAYPYKDRLDPYIVHVIRHVFGDASLKSLGIPPPSGPSGHSFDRSLAEWLNVPSAHISEVDLRYRGLWKVVRASSPSSENGNSFDLSEINVSLLNIRPRAFRGDNLLCEFRWYYRGKGRESHERRIFEGYVAPSIDRLEFLGRASSNKLPTLMVWPFFSDAETTEHAEVASGVSLSLNTLGAPVAARVRAFFVAGSQDLKDDAFKTTENNELKDIGVKPIDSLESLISPDHIGTTRRYLAECKPAVGFFTTTHDNRD
jgi:hypothetical protein